MRLSEGEMMTRKEKLMEAKLMAVESIISKIPNKDLDSFETFVPDYYAYAKEILSAIRDVEIKQELLDHEASLEEASRNRPE